MDSYLLTQKDMEKILSMGRITSEGIALLIEAQHDKTTRFIRQQIENIPNPYKFTSCKIEAAESMRQTILDSLTPPEGKE